MEIPQITIIGGFLGAGKTTLLNRMIAALPAERLGVLINDFGDLGVEGALVEGAADGVIRLPNGCLCCTMKNDVVAALERLLAREAPPSRVLVEASGISDPGTVAETFLGLQRQGRVHLDAILALIDAETWGRLGSRDDLLARCQALAADIVILNKQDLVDAARLDAVEAEIRAHAPWARILRATEAEVPVDLLVGHDPDPRRPAAAPEHADYETYRFVSERPLRFRALAPALTGLGPEVLRAKGIVSLEERPGDRLVLHLVGRRVYVRTIEAPPGPSVLLFIGRDLDRAAMERALRADQYA